MRSRQKNKKVTRMRNVKVGWLIRILGSRIFFFALILTLVFASVFSMNTAMTFKGAIGFIAFGIYLGCLIELHTNKQKKVDLKSEFFVGLGFGIFITLLSGLDFVSGIGLCLLTIVIAMSHPIWGKWNL
jgi:hypothetical protein